MQIQTWVHDLRFNPLTMLKIDVDILSVYFIGVMVYLTKNKTHQEGYMICEIFRLSEPVSTLRVHNGPTLVLDDTFLSIIT